ncbi:B-4DMT family transporter [Mycolicibacterium komossense]|uniref:B-4DMT family transporter n=1 Tax=Mycolicibacterium komossense TaxID=1779 RepID=A0ABT3CCF1_9MYCO|nr:B-4DMT family transporter [Mycolicibacterium komossense]MCV7226921.1 B-4DMT family transporter [Mycolicibacterium komossense]
MSKWLVRGLVFAALMVIVRLVQGALINAFETKALIISIVLLVVFAIAVAVWGFVDGRADARANPDPDRRNDLAMTWLLAGLFAGVVSGAVAWLISVFYKGLYTGGLINEVTTFAAFTALLIFVPAIIAVSVGRWLVDRKAPPVVRKGANYDEGRADTDVFAAVRDDNAPATALTAEHEAHHEAEPQTSAVATAERHEHTEPISEETTVLEDKRTD